MKEFVEKLIGRLEEELRPDKECFEYEDDYMYAEERHNKMLKIVNQIAGEYKPQLNDNDLMIVESLPSLYPMKEFEEEALQRVIGCAKKEYNNGWIPCSERLPEDYTEVLGYGIDGHIYMVNLYDTEIYGKVWKQWNGGDIRLKFIDAWQPLPEPYQPKGE